MRAALSVLCLFAAAGAEPVSDVLACAMFKLNACGGGCTPGPCAYDHVPAGCRGEWGQWSRCSGPCGGDGNQSRVFRVLAPASGGGGACSAVHGQAEARVCSNLPCPVDCAGAWQPWSNCSVECGDGVRSRVYIATAEAAHGGSVYTCPPAGSRTAVQPCNLGDCVGMVPCLTDMCGVCDLNVTNDCAQDCEGVWGGGREIDQCGVCGGASDCIDCSGEPHGAAYEDECNGCDDDGENDCVGDCQGVWGGGAVIDECKVCGGDNTTCKKTHTKVAAASDLQGGVSPDAFKNAVAAMVSGGDAAVAVQVEITSFTQTADASMSLDGFSADDLTEGSDGLEQVLRGIAASLNVSVADISVGGISRRRLQDLASIAYGIVAQTDISSLMSDPVFGSSLTGAINGAGDALALDASALTAPEPTVATAVEYEVVHSVDSDAPAPPTSSADALSAMSDASAMASALNDAGGSVTGASSTVSAPAVVTVDCRGVPGGTAQLDLCFICEGDNTSCLDCNNVPMGRAREDRCGVCDNDYRNNCRIDCTGVWGGGLVMDKCLVCNGTNACTDCAGRPRGSSRVDQCGRCDASLSNDCTEDCTGVWGGP
eukprot:SAG22_NODE_2570_length_2429_cov_2.121030_1_plen_597_part_01